MLRNALLLLVVAMFLLVALPASPLASTNGPIGSPTLVATTPSNGVSQPHPTASSSFPIHDSASLGPDYWPMYLYNPEHTSSNPNDTIISASNASSLTLSWASQITTASPIASVIAASTEVVGDMAYVGDWDGNETAVNATTGQIVWQTFLGQTDVPNCNSPRGVTSSAAIYNGTVYVGGGDDYWYALNATTGAVEWKTYVGNNSASGGDYNWASPVIYNGYEYIGVASDCDEPLVRGELMQVDLANHTVVNQFYTVPTGKLGGTIWTTPTIDAAQNEIIVSLGNCMNDKYTESPYCGGLIAINLTNISQGSCAATCDTSEMKGYWQDTTCVPAVSDCDMTPTATLFKTSTGTEMVETADKNGTVWAFNAADITAGAVWHTKVALGGNIEKGKGLAATPVWTGKYLVVAGQQETLSGTTYWGSIQALWPDNGTPAWRTPLPQDQTTFGAVVYQNGAIIEGGGNLDPSSSNEYNGTLFILNASNGKILWEYETPGLFYDSATVALGHIYIGNFLGTLYCFGVPQTLKINSFTATPPVISLRNSTTLSVTATGGLPPYTYFYTGLPTPCVSANSSSLVCTPTETGTFPINVQVTDSNGTIVNAQTSFEVTSQTLYSVTFTESGLPSSTSWSVTLNGSLLSSTTTTIVFMEPSGLYPFSVTPISGYLIAPGSGDVTVSGMAAGQSVTFTASSSPQYTLSVLESGLPGGTSWSITISGTIYTSTTNAISTQEPNGSYPVTVGAVAGYSASQTAFTIIIAGANASHSISWSLATYTLTFQESGLPSGTGWGVTLNGSLSTSTSATIVFNGLKDGNYSFSITSVSGYTASPASGTAKVQGQNATQAISFSSSSPSSSGSSGLTTTEYIIVGVVVLVIAGCLAAVLLTRRRPPKQTTSTESTSGGTGPSTGSGPS
ncbi:MAG: PQQ-binding-like beta-propeller repeat protein [Thermoplasmata archaeon]